MPSRGKPGWQGHVAHHMGYAGYMFYLRAAAPAADPGKGTKQLLAPFSWQGNTMPLKDGEAPKLHPENA